MLFKNKKLKKFLYNTISTNNRALLHNHLIPINKIHYGLFTLILSIKIKHSGKLLKSTLLTVFLLSHDFSVKINHSGFEERIMRLTTEELVMVALKYRNRTDFRKGDSTAYNASRKKGALDYVCGHMPRRSYRYKLSELVCEAEKYTTRYQFCQGSNKAYQAALRQDAMDLVCFHMADNYEPQVIATSVKPANPLKTPQAQKVRAHATCI